MTSCQKAAISLSRCLQDTQTIYQTLRSIRKFSSTSQANEVAIETVSKPAPNPMTVTSSREERKLMRAGILPIGSRRRRAALRTSENIPFDQLPYLCFQEARKILKAERESVLEKIKTQRLRIANLAAQDHSIFKNGQPHKERRQRDMLRYLEELKIQADINDPMIKKRFEDGDGDMNKPIYRHLADQKWRSYHRKIIAQRIGQFFIVPDLLPELEPTASVELAFKKRKVQPGDYVDSRISEFPARLKVQVFNKGERLVTIVVIDSDVPISETDTFTARCHFLGANIPISPTQTSVPLSQSNPDTQLILPWLPPFAQKGSPYHRYSVFVLQQPKGTTLDVTKLKEIPRDNFNLSNFIRNYEMEPIGVTLFRSTWDDGTALVMHRASIEGSDLVFKRKRVIALKHKEKPRGWEAKRARSKYDAAFGKNRRSWPGWRK